MVWWGKKGQRRGMSLLEAIFAMFYLSSAILIIAHLLDAGLQALVEDDRAAADLVAAGQPVDVVQRVSNLLDLAEYKRRQAPPGVKITTKAFGRDRRYPITNHFRRLGLEKG